MNRLTEELIKRKKIILYFFMFLGFMFLCTLISKGIYSSQLTRIRTAKTERTGIAHLVEKEGSIMGGNSLAVNVVSGLRVDEVYIRRGDKIAADIPLFKINLQDIKDKIAEQELNIRKLELETQSKLENEALNQIKDETARKRAAEDYKLRVDAAQDKINEMKKELDIAEDKLEEHNKNSVKVTSDKKRKDEKSDYKDWQSEGVELEERVSDAQKELASAQKNLEDGTGTQEEVDTAENELEKAQDRLSDYRKDIKDNPDFSQEDAEYSAWKSEKESLEEALKTAQKNYDAAVRDKETVILEAQRALEDTHGNIPSDSTAETNQMEIAYQKENLEKYRALLTKEGVVYSNLEGIVTSVGVSAGEKTPDGASIVYADLRESLRFQAKLTKEEKKYVDLGDSIEIKLDSSLSLELTAEYLMPDENDPDSYILSCSLPEGKGTIGQSATLRAQKLSEQYNNCIPAEALHSEGGRDYIYVVKEKNTVLGKELSASRVWVKVLDKNDKYAALEEGAVEEDAEIILEGDKEIKDGDIVRYDE